MRGDVANASTDFYSTPSGQDATDRTAMLLHAAEGKSNCDRTFVLIIGWLLSTLDHLDQLLAGRLQDMRACLQNHKVRKRIHI